MTLPVDLDCLWANPDQAGNLQKHSHKRMSGWQDRFFVLKGSILYYFENRSNIKKLHGIIPLERARIQASPPDGYLKGGAKSNAQQQHGLCITITLHVQFSYIAKHPFYVLLAPTPEVQAAWLLALRQASIPRATLLNRLYETGDMPQVVKECCDQTSLCFPTTSAAVISSSSFIRLETATPVGSASPAPPTDAITTITTHSAIAAETTLIPAVNGGKSRRNSVAAGRTSVAAGGGGGGRKSLVMTPVNGLSPDASPLRSTFGMTSSPREVDTA